jgi:hypothetical protein
MTRASLSEDLFTNSEKWRIIFCLSKFVVPVSGSVTTIEGPSSSGGPPVGEDGVAQLSSKNVTIPKRITVMSRFLLLKKIFLIMD